MNTSVSAFHKDVMDNISVSQKFVKSVAPVFDFMIVGKYRVYRCIGFFWTFVATYLVFAQSKDICSWLTVL